MLTGKEFAKQAQSSKYDKMKYSKEQTSTEASHIQAISE